MSAVKPASDRIGLPYDPADVAERSRARWAERGLPTTPAHDAQREDTFIFVTNPFTSGDPHMGHVRSYTIGDAYARFRRAKGDAVLFSLGFDTFGLPSELAAIEQGMTCRQWVDHCRGRMRTHFTNLGLSFDWSRSFGASDPEIYKWTQWLFLKFYEADLIYTKDGQVEWCDSCRNVVANLQVEDGNCWRCHEPVRLVQRAQWYLRKSAYNEESARCLDRMADWSRPAVATQRAVLGEVVGVELDAVGLDGVPFPVFTPFAESIAEAEFVLVSPNHPEIERWLLSEESKTGLEALQQGQSRREDRKEALTKVFDTRAIAKIPGVDQTLPVLISPSVDGRFGPTAVLGIPSRDRSDAALAKAYQAGAHSALQMSGGRRKGDPRPAVRFQAADFTISRQRAWGAPIPLVHCDECGTVPVPEDQLPVELPDDLPPAGKGLDSDLDFQRCSCPKCGSPSRRETETLDCHMDASWSMFPMTVPKEERDSQIFGHPEMRRWLPVDQMVHGSDIGNFVLSMRLFGKALRDLELIELGTDGEPFVAALAHEMVLSDGRKMSKHLENGVSPEQLVNEFGADAVRFAVLFAAAPAKSFSWNEHALRYCASFLEELWNFAAPRLSAVSPVDPDAEIDTQDKLRGLLDLWCDKGMEKISQNYEQLQMHQATRNTMRFAERINDFVARVDGAERDWESEDHEAVATALLRLVQVLAPIAPHLSEELWFQAGCDGLVVERPWADTTTGRSRPNPAVQGRS